MSILSVNFSWHQLCFLRKTVEINKYPKITFEHRLQFCIDSQSLSFLGTKLALADTMVTYYHIQIVASDLIRVSEFVLYQSGARASEEQCVIS